MRLENWIVAAGAVFAVCVVGGSVLSDMFLGTSSQNGSQTAAIGDGQGGMSAVGNGAPSSPSVAMPQGAAGFAGLVPFTQAKSTRFRGRVVRVISLNSDTGWGQLHVWVDSGGGQSQEVSIAPDWYLMHMGCMIKENANVDGVAFTFGKTPELYAKTVTVGGKTCRLRNDEGFALWSNRLR